MAEAGYLNFDLEIERTAQGYRGQVLSSPAGEARAELLPLESLDVAAASQEVGAQLFDATFRGEVLTCWRRSLDMAQQQDRGLRLRLRLTQVPELANLPWELIYDSSRDRFLALSPETPLVRYMDLPEPPPDLMPGLRLRVLAVIASPRGYPALDVEREWANLAAALEELQRRGIVTLDRLEPPTLEALQRQLQTQQYHILHFLGHGAFDPAGNDSVLMLQAEDGAAQAVTGQVFSTLLQGHDQLRLVLLNACQGAESSDRDPYAGVAQRLVRGGVPAVIAMRTAISDQAAIALARSFYAALANGAAVDSALAEARKALFTGCCAEEWATPVLYMRAAEGQLWRQPEPEPLNWRKKIALPAGILLLLILVLFGVYNVAVPATMDAANTLNVAVAEVPRLDAAGGASATPDGRLIRDWTVNSLAAANETLEPGRRVGIWHDGMSFTQKRVQLSFISGATAEQRAAAAEVLAARVDADVVIYSHLALDEGGVTRLVQEFYVSSRLRPEANETIGRYQLGDAIILPADLASADSLAREATARLIEDRATLLFGTLLGLREDVLGRHEEALALLRTVESTTPTSRQPGAGGDVLYYFIARQALFLGRNAEAEAAAEQALALNPQRERAAIVLGGAHLRSAAALAPADQLTEDGLLQQAEAAYQQAVDLSVASRDTRMELVARLAMANATLARATAIYQLDDPEAGDLAAEQLFERAAADLRLLLAPLDELKQYRLLGQGYAYLGVARLQQGNLALRAGDRTRAASLLSEARGAFDGCEEQARRLPEDRTLAEKIVAAVCQPSRQQVEDALQGIGG